MDVTRQGLLQMDTSSENQLKQFTQELFLTENDVKHTFKAPCCCFENAPNTALNIVLIINVSIDYNWFEVPNLLRKKNMLK